MGREEIAATYLRHHLLKQQEDSWAVREVDTLVRDDPTEAWEVTRVLVNTAPSNEALAYVAAGPLEELLHRHGSVLIDPIEEESKGNARLQLALSGVWGLDRSSPVLKLVLAHVEVRICRGQAKTALIERLIVANGAVSQVEN